MSQQSVPAELDADKLAEVTLALLALTVHDERRAWKGIDWGVMHLLYERGWIHDPKGTAKSVVLTDEGLALFENYQTNGHQPH
jgi:hypothetical protein